MIIKKQNLIIILSSLVILIAILISLFLFKCVQDEPEQSVITNAYNQNCLVVIDPGHGGEDGGAVATATDGNEILEKDLNLKISLYLKEFLLSAGYTVEMTRTEDVSINDEGIETLKSRKISDMHNRLAMYNGNEENIVISIHQNKFTQEKYSGTQVFYSPNNRESSVLADSIRHSVTGMLQPDNTRETKSADKSIYLLWNSEVPTVIVECGFLSNNNELARLQTDEYQRQMAFSIFCGFLEYNNQNNGSENNGI